MSMDREDIMNVAVLAAVAVGGFLLWKGVNAATKAAGAVVDGVSQVAGAAGDTAAGGISAIGSLFGLPTIAQTIDNPAQVRWIIDNVGSWTASQWGTAAAYVSALNMPAGSGNNSPPPAHVLQALGISTGTQVPNTQAAVVDHITGGRDYSGSMLGGVSFGDVASGNTSTNPFQWW